MIGANAFELCRCLTALTIPSSVISIGEGAFSGCSELDSIEFEGTIEQWLSIEKGYYWMEEVPVMTVSCSDGEADLTSDQMSY